MSKVRLFQFHKGTIRTIDKYMNKLNLTNFNSIKVRLELMQDELPLKSSVFQFHKGTIRTSYPRMREGPYLQFQFHKGTIRTNHLPKSVQWRTNFNSIKVRLEQLFSNI